MRTIKREIVGAFIFSSDDKILLGQSIEGGVYSDQWVVPGGGIEDGETEIEAVNREILEEVGLDISDAIVTAIDGLAYGESEKVLRDTNEKVLVKMTFHDFEVKLKYPSTEIFLKVEDDLSIAKWFSAQDLEEVRLGLPTEEILKKIGFIK